MHQVPEHKVTITITGNMIAYASYTQNTYTLSVTTTGSGYVTVNPSQILYHYGDTVMLTATRIVRLGL